MRLTGGSCGEAAHANPGSPHLAGSATASPRHRFYPGFIRVGKFGIETPARSPTRREFIEFFCWFPGSRSRFLGDGLTLAAIGSRCLKPAPRASWVCPRPPRRPVPAPHRWGRLQPCRRRPSRDGKGDACAATPRSHQSGRCAAWVTHDGEFPATLIGFLAPGAYSPARVQASARVLPPTPLLITCLSCTRRDESGPAAHWQSAARRRPRADERRDGRPARRQRRAARARSSAADRRHGRGPRRPAVRRLSPSRRAHRSASRHDLYPSRCLNRAPPAPAARR